MCVIVVADDYEPSYSADYGATHDRDALRQRSSIFWNSSVPDTEYRQWDLNYREAALYLKVDGMIVFIYIDCDSGLFTTARCTLVQSAVLRSHVVCPSVCLSVTLVDCDHIGWNSSKIILPLVLI